MMLIDVHAHTFPDAIAERAIKKLVEKTNHTIAAVSDGTLSGLLDQMRKSHVDASVLCPIATRPEQWEGILNEACAIREGAYGAEARAHLIPLSSVHPADPLAETHLKQVAERGIVGIKLHPYYQEFVLDAPEMLRVFACCRDLDLVVQCHCGYDIGFPFDPICSPDRVRRVIDAVPGIKLIAAHLGGWRDWRRVRDCLVGQNVYLDTAVLQINVEDADARAILHEHPAERLLFATDAPWTRVEDGVRFVQREQLPAEAERAIFGANAATLFKWKNV